MTTNKPHFDIVIAGGGLSGALSALALSQLKHSNGESLSIAIIEANPILTDAKLTFDSRVLALSHQSATYLDSLHVWSELANDAAPIENIHISDRGYYGKARLSANDHQVPALGYVIEMARIGQVLINALKKLANITWLCPETIQTIEWQRTHVDILLDSAQQVSASLVLGCDGAQSQIRQQANINSTHKPYEQSALIANVLMSKVHENRAFERFTEFGPIAMLPLTDDVEANKRCSLVWTLPPEQAKLTAQLSDSEFKQALEQAFGSWLGTVVQVGKREVYPLNLVRADEQIFHRTALIGNAAHAIHPIAGQGFNLGLRDVETLVMFVGEAIADEENVASLNLLTNYAAKRKVDHDQVITLTDSLVTLFSNHLPPLVVGRNIGLKVLNYLTPLKKAFADKTMGY